ncbi:MAG TPA: hypothetical protein VK507_17385 [Iamia sp.]|nr:hypothetical protein [Iamia sp.]
MLVDELLIPHPDGSVRVRLDERVTVLAGLDGPSRARFAHLLASGLAGAGPATIVVRDDLGRPGRIEPGTTAGPIPPGPDAVAEVRRLVVVGPAELGVRHELPTPSLAAERTAAAIAHRQLAQELEAVRAGAAERARLLREIGDEGRDPTDDEVARRPDLEAVAASAARIDELLQRRREAGDRLERTAAVLRAVDDDPTRPPPPAAGDPDLTTGPLATGLLAAVDVVRRVSGATPAETADQRRVEHDARLALARAVAEIDRARTEAQAEVDACDHELAALAGAADVPVGPEGPGAALTAALESRRHRVAAAADTDPATRLLARRRAALRARLEGLPDDTDLAAARRRLGAVADHLARLEGGGGADVERTRESLLGRVALLRPDGVTSIAPLVLDEALVGLAPDDLCDLLDLVVRLAERIQVVLLTGDPAVATWARHRAASGVVRLVDLVEA